MSAPLFRCFSRPGVVRSLVLPALILVGLTAILVTPSHFTSTIGYEFFVVTFCFPVLLYLAARSHLPEPLNRVCAVLGDLSYPLYILHAPLVLPLGGSKPLLFFSLHPLAARLLLPLCFALLLASAWLVARYPDRSCRLWLTRHYNSAATST